MKVIVLKDDGNFYKTWAGAIYYNGWKTEVFLLNEDDEFERVYEYKQNKKSIEKSKDTLKFMIKYVKYSNVFFIFQDFQY